MTGVQTCALPIYLSEFDIERLEPRLGIYSKEFQKLPEVKPEGNSEAHHDDLP